MIMPMQYSPQFRARAISLLDSGTTVSELAESLNISAATIYRWRRQHQIDLGLIPGNSSMVNAELAAANRRISELEQLLKATELAAKVLQDQTIRPKDVSR